MMTIYFNLKNLEMFFKDEMKSIKKNCYSFKNTLRYYLEKYSEAT